MRLIKISIVISFFIVIITGCKSDNNQDKAEVEEVNSIVINEGVDFCLVELKKAADRSCNCDVDILYKNDSNIGEKALKKMMLTYWEHFKSNGFNFMKLSEDKIEVIELSGYLNIANNSQKKCVYFINCILYFPQENAFYSKMVSSGGCEQIEILAILRDNKYQILVIG